MELALMPNKPLSWNQLMEGLVVGAVRGMAEAHASLEAAAPGSVPALTDLAMYQAAEVLAATLLEDSVECSEERDFQKASRIVGRNVFGYLKTLRQQREKNRIATLFRILDQAGLERQRPN